MAIIKTYPLKSNYYGPDRLILSDMQPDSLGVVHGTTKSLTLSSLKSFIGSGSSSFTLVVDRTSGAATFDTNTNILNIPDYSIANPVDGSGTAGRIPKWSDSNTLDDSEIFQSGTNIGIGTTNPTEKLQINSGYIKIVDNAYDEYFLSKQRTDNSQVVGFKSQSSGRLSIHADRVGIGTTAPAKKLDVNGDVTFGTGNKFQTEVNAIVGLGENGVFLRSAVSTAANPSFSNNDDQNTGMFLPGSDIVGFTTNASEKMRITSAGDVGIGTTSPNDGDLTIGIPKLHVATGGTSGTFNLAARFQSTTIDADNTGTSILINSLNDRGLLIKAGRKDGDREVAYFDLVTSIGNTTNMLTMGKFDNSYYVGIGTTSPSAKLDVAGSMNVGGIATLKGDGTNDGKLRFNCSANTHYVEIVGPTHSGGSSYSLKLPNSLPNVSAQILQSNASGVLGWIPTPSGGGGGGGGTITSVGLTMPSSFAVTGSPLSGTGGTISVGVTGGSAGQYLDYQGNWSTPSAGTTSVTNGNPPASTGSALTISPTTGAVIVTSNTYAGTNKVGHVPAGGTASTFLRGDATWVTPTASLNFFKTIATPTNNVVASGNDDTLTLAAGNNTGIFINGSGSQVTIGLSAPTVLDRGGVKLVNATQQSTAANGLTTTAGRTYAIQLNSSGQAVVNVPWSGGSGGGISFSGTTSGGLATYTNSSTANVSSKVTLNASGLMQFDADHAGGSRASIDYNPTGNRLQIGDFSGGSAIVELYTDGNRQFQIGVNGEIGLGSGASQGTNGQVLTSQGNGSQAYWTNKTTIPSNNVTGSGTTYDVPMWNVLPDPQAGIAGSYIGAGGGFNSSPFKSNASGQSIISTEVNGGITFRNSTGALVTINGGTSSGGAYTINLPSATAAAIGQVLQVTSLGTGITRTAWVTPYSNITSLTGATSVSSSTFANTPFAFANTNTGSGAGAPLATQVSNSYGNKHIAFYLGTTFSGAINQSGSSTVNYATSSDYRLKENVVEMTGAIDRVKQLKPSRFNFIADGPSRIVDGFLAHEVSSIVPESITGDKDAVDAESNIIPQGIDQSKLVPLLVGAIKELTARIEALEA
jgi:hypothetical protein